MRLVVVVSLLLALPAGACGWRPVYENPRLQEKVDRLWKERDDCLLANAPQFDDRSSDARKVGRLVAAACATQTMRLMEMTIPEPDQKARDAFQAGGRAPRRGYRGDLPPGGCHGRNASRSKSTTERPRHCITRNAERLLS